MIDYLNGSLGVGMGERVQLAFGAAYFVIGAILLRPVREPPPVERDVDPMVAPA